MTKTDALDIGKCSFQVSRRESAGLTEIISLTMMLVLPTFSASASEASPWDGDRNSAVGLIAGVPHSEGGSRVLRAGIEVKLSRGWKMYWRYPGDAGVPPRFDFSGSQNVSDITVSWPAPTRFSDAGTHLVVYKDHVVLPLRITPSDPQLPVILRVNLDYGICEKLCVLAEAKLELALAGIQVFTRRCLPPLNGGSQGKLKSATATYFRYVRFVGTLELTLPRSWSTSWLQSEQTLTSLPKVQQVIGHYRYHTKSLVTAHCGASPSS